MNKQDLALFTELNENQLAHYYEPAPGIFIAESVKVTGRALQAGYEPLIVLSEQRHVDGGCFSPGGPLEKAGSVPLHIMTNDDISSMAGYHLTGGLLCALRRRTLPEAKDLCRNARRVAVLENVMNPTNLGAIFRSAAAMRIDAVLLTGGCTDPLYRRAARVSMGTVFQIPWTFVPGADASDCISMLRGLGYRSAALALRDDAILLGEDPAPAEEEKLAVVLGTEGTGLTPQAIAACDYVIKIPMAEGVDSLNVAAASAVAFWELV